MSGIAAFNKVMSVKTTAATAYTELPGSNASLTFQGELLDDTTFETSGWRSRVRGLRDYNLSVTAVYNSTHAGLAIIRSALLSGVNLNFRYLPDGTRGFGGRVKVESFNLAGDVGGLETVDIGLQPTGTALTTV